MDSRSINKAVTEAYDEGTYTDNEGTAWRRGMDGWFDVLPGGAIDLTPHNEMVVLIEKENP